MVLRYRKQNNLFIPQYQLTDLSWKDFQVKEIGGDLLRLCRAIGDIQWPRKWEDGIWHYDPSRGEIDQDQSLIFKTEMFVSAFLAAANSHYDTSTVNFTPPNK